MVAAARKEREVAERRNEQLRAQLNDTELLLASHQEQLADLKTVMQHMSSDRDEAETNTNLSTAPSTPGFQNQDSLTKIFDALHLSPNTPGMDDIPAAPPTSFTHLIHPILRTDLQAYDDFHSLLKMSRRSTPPSRATSGSYGGINVMSLGNLTNQTQPQPLGHVPSNGSTSSLGTAGTHASSPATPNTPLSTNSSVSSREASYANTPLKETRFYKRALPEDIEPTLRLDLAPGLSWLARRTVLNSMCEGSLVVEPMPASAKLQIFSCALCGEHRKDEEHARTHRFRTSENDNAQRYPLCNYCLGRVRASCDFLGFLRMIRDGHWRTDGEEGEKAAWEESVKLRERMFWARIGGGVVPAFVQTRDSPRGSTDDAKDKASKLSQEVLTDDIQTNPSRTLTRENEDPFHSDQKRVSIGNTIIARSDSNDDDSWENAKTAAIFDDDNSLPQSTTKAIKDEATSQLRSNLHDSLSSKSVVATEKKRPEMVVAGTSEKRLSITIPGAFE